MSAWIANRIREASSHQGAIVVAAAVAVIWFAIPLTKVVVWGALAWGVWSILKQEYNYGRVGNRGSITKA